MLRSTLAAHPELEVVAINDLGSPEALAQLFARDSVHGRYSEPVTAGDHHMTIGSRQITMIAESSAKALPWKDLGVDIVIEATGRYTSHERAFEHIEAGATRVIISAPAEDPDATFVMGVNDDEFDPTRHYIISNASCTTNCLAPMVKVLDDAYGLEEGFMTTVHAYTDDQRLVDALHTDPRRARGAAINIVPTTTGAAKAIGLVIPNASQRLDGLSLRVPVADVSITDVVAMVRASPNREDINEAFRFAAASEPLSGLLEFSDEPLVSSDIINSTASCVFDSQLTMAEGHLVKILGWYDNETGYASRLADLAQVVGGATQ